MYRSDAIYLSKLITMPIFSELELIENNIDPLIYFSGTLNPYKEAARFSIYRDTIEVRKFWDIEGVDIDFEVYKEGS